MYALDNPIWHALSTRQRSLAEGDDLAKRFPPAVTPLASLKDTSALAYASLADLLGPQGAAGLFQDLSPSLPNGWGVLRTALLNQMVYSGSAEIYPQHDVEELGLSQVQEMTALTKLTEPGPFGPRTPELGNYFGIYRSGQLVAMAGERLRMTGFCEVSAVCTHPEHRGHGYATSLLSAVIVGVIKRGETPFLHVLAENSQAIHVYQKLGFNSRRLLHLTVVTSPHS